MADQARESTSAYGAAIALSEINPGEITCCARSGIGAPELGTALLVKGSLTALCIESGKQLWRDNAETDEGAHSVTVAELRVRSVVVTPIQRGEHVLGVLVVCATGAGAFSELHRFLLQTAANHIAAVLEEKIRPAQERIPRLLPNLSRPKPPVSARLPLPGRAIRPEQPEPGTKTEAGPIDITLHNFATFDSVSRQQKRWLSSNVILTCAMALLIIAGIALVYMTRTGSSSSHLPSNTQLSNDAGLAALSPGHQATLRIDPGSTAPQLGSTFVLKVECSLGQNISNVPAQVNYDSNILQFVAVTGGEFLSQDGAQIALVHRDDPATGILKINAQRPPGSSGVSGNGTVFSLVFLAKARGVGTVSLVAPEAANSQSQTVSAEGAQTLVTVN